MPVLEGVIISQVLDISSTQDETCGKQVSPLEYCGMNVIVAGILRNTKRSGCVDSG